MISILRGQIFILNCRGFCIIKVVVSIDDPLEFTIPQSIKENWQRITNLLADMMGAEAGFITQITGEELKVLMASGDEEMEIAEGDVIELADVFCHEVVKKQEMVEINDASQIEKWQDSAELDLGFISYLGVPNFYPQKEEVFGTICVVDSKSRSFSQKEKDLLKEFKLSIENQLENIILNNKLGSQVEFIQSSLNSLSAHIAVIDKEGIIRYTNKAWDDFAQKSGISPEQVGEGINYLEIIEKAKNEGAEKAEEALRGIKSVIAGERDSFALEYPCDTPGEKKWFKMRVTPFQSSGEHAAVVAHEDITERKQMEEELNLTQFSIDNAAVGVFQITPRGKFEYVNEKVCEMLNYSREELIGKRVSDVDADHSAAERKYFWDKIKHNKTNVIETRHQTKTGEVFPVQVTSRYLKYKDKEYEFAFVQDISERKEKERQLKYKSFHDELTGLYNREFLAREMERLDTERQLPISTLMVDINGLKLINNTYGHEKGDRILKKAAEILESVVRDEDILARYGGDEFVIMLPQTSNKIAHDIYDRIEKRCQDTCKEEFPVSLGMGIATKTNPEEDIKDILKQADENMLQNKLVDDRSSKNRMVKGLLNTLGAKSDETREHAMRMTNLAHQLGERVGVTNSELNKLSLLATLHDIGKTSIPEEVLTKPGDLTEEEWQMMQEHPEKGYKIASASKEFAVVAEEILSHHERWDGKGYPRGLKCEKIPFLARIISIVDAYDVMTNGRPYKKPMSKEEALKEIEACAGSQFDPELAEEFVEMMSEKS